MHITIKIRKNIPIAFRFPVFIYFTQNIIDIHKLVKSGHTIFLEEIPIRNSIILQYSSETSLLTTA